jgi:hypothetical protein
VFVEANLINHAFLSINEQVNCYKVELAQMLQMVVESYSSILLQ